jgi:hypothetical protein
MNPMIVGGASLVALGLILLVSVLLSRKHNKGAGAKANDKTKKDLAASYEKAMQEDVYHIFSKEFHEELRNKARLDFQRVINENAMFLQQDLRLTTSELNDYLKNEISTKLQEEFSAYQQSIKDVQNMAIESINNTVMSSQQQQAELNHKLQEEAEARKAKIIENFEANMSEVVSHYVLKAVGSQLDLKDQLPFIIREMQSQQEAMKKDMWL